MVFKKYSLFYVFCTQVCFVYQMIFEGAINILVNLGLYNWKFAQLPDSLEGKTVVITGANSGIGKECAKTCLRLGAKVIIACRNQAKSKLAMKDMLTQVILKKKASLNLV